MELTSCSFISSAIGTIGVLVGVLIGNHLAIGRDKRREFKTLVDPVRMLLLLERGKPTPYHKTPSHWDFILISEKMPCWKRGRFDRAVRDYFKGKNADNRDNQNGKFFYRNQEIVARAVENLLKFLKPI